MRPVISVLLPTVRPSLAYRALASLTPAAAGLPYEAIVVADFTPADIPPSVYWVKRERAGVVDALNTAMLLARGDYVFSFNDESTLEPGALAALYVAAQKTPRAILTPLHQPLFSFAYYGRQFAPFPFVSCIVLKELGGIADPAYRAFYSDPDLSMRAHEKRIPVQTVLQAVIYHHNDHDSAHQQNVNNYLAQDREVFRSRWDHLGVFCDP